MYMSSRKKTVISSRLQSETKKWRFSREDTTVVKGVAIVLMLLHHAFFFPNRISPSCYQFSFITLGNTSPMSFLADYGKICVALFFFLSGFGLMKARGASAGVRIFKSLKKLLISYWRVLLSFVPIGFVFFANLPHNYAIDPNITEAWSDRSLETAVQSLFGMSESYNHEWWFLSAFILTIMTMPVFEVALRKFRTFWSGLAFVAGIEFTFTAIVPFMESASFPMYIENSFVFCRIVHGIKLSTPFYMGMLMGSKDYFSELHDALQTCDLTSPFAALLALIGTVLLRNCIFGESSDPFTVPIVALAIKDLADAIKPLKHCFLALGHHSTTMWLTHTFLLYYYCENLQSFIMFQHWWVITLVWFVAVSFFVSFLFDRLWLSILDNR